jgi:hypothetical protein
MFRYNYVGFNENQNSIYDSSITNTRYFKFMTTYKSDMWTWKTALIMAKARETASAGKKSYHHEEGYRFDSTQDQDDDMGYELDINFEYKWNPNITFGGFFGYWWVGQYYAYTNTGSSIGLANVMGTGLKVAVDF